MNLEWNPEKAESNLLKHQLSFVVAGRVFLDPERIETLNSRNDYGEARWITVGLAEGILVTVVYTLRGKDGNVIRLISARKADKHERAQYGQI